MPLNAPLNDGERDFLQGLRLKGVEEALEELDPALPAAHPDRRHCLHPGHSRAGTYVQRFKIADLPLFVKWWEETGRTQSINLPQNSRAITIISIHKSKGLAIQSGNRPLLYVELSPKRGSLLWACCRRSTVRRIGEMPIRYKNEMGVSYFSEAFTGKRYSPTSTISICST
ncbi:MAG: hypothetical protein ACLR8Y_18640 [Alistipes indistinctus]